MKLLGSVSLIGKVFLILAVLAVVMGGGLYQINRIQDSAEQALVRIIDRDEAGIVWLARSRSVANMMGRLSAEMVSETSGVRVRQIIKRLSEQNAVFLGWLDQSEQTLKEPGEDFSGIRKSFERVSTPLDALIAARSEQADGAASDVVRDRARSASQAIEEFDAQLKSVVEQAMARTQERARQASQAARANSLYANAVVAGTIAVAFLLAFVYLRLMVVQPLQRLTAVAASVLSGHLDVVITGTDRKDEIGDVARVCRQLKDSLGAIDELSRRTTAAAQQVAAATSQAAAAVEQVSDGSQRQMQSVESITGSMSRTSAVIGTIASVSLSAKERSREAALRLAEGLRQIEAMTAAVREIAVTSDRINRITQSIGELATRSNILSLNAAIEAARAGENGKGFAVVAEEVGNLAQQTGNLAQEIALLAADSTERIQNGVNTATEVGGVMENVAAAINDTDSLSGDIAQSMEEQGGVLKQIEQSLQRLREISNANATASEEIAATMVELARLADTTRLEAQQARLGGVA